MPVIFNIHTPSHSFALPYRANESTPALLTRILRKSGLEEKDYAPVKEGKDGAGVKYEWEGGRWSLSDDDDLSILLSRFPPDSTPSITLHLTPSSNTTNSNGNTLYKSDPSSNTHNSSTNTNSNGSISGGSKKKRSGPKSVVSFAGSTKKGAPSVHGPTGAVRMDALQEEGGEETLGEKKKRQWRDFHENNGVRTVVGRIGKVDGVRMLLKAGYRHVYVSRPFAVKNGLIPKTSAMGTYGYAGLVNLGQMPITIGRKTANHTVMLSEESNFDVVLGRSWMEKMGIKTDPVDQTSVTYMETGEQIQVDIVVLRDSNGEVIHIS